jgi:hypothetical protein
MYDKCVFMFNFILKGTNFWAFGSTTPNLRLAVLIMVVMKSTGFWDVLLCCLLEVYQHSQGRVLRNVTTLLPGNTVAHHRSLFNLHPIHFHFYVSDTWGNFPGKKKPLPPCNESHLHIKKLIILFKLLWNFQQLNTEGYQLNYHNLYDTGHLFGNATFIKYFFLFTYKR